MKNIVIIILIICISSCKNNGSSTEELLLGHWSVIEEDKLKQDGDITIVDNRAFEFLEGGIVDYKPGYFDYEGFHNDISRKSNKYYLGTETKFAIKDDSLKIYNLFEKKWQGLKIKKITADTLVIGQDTLWTTFIKKRYDIDSIPDFDAIKVYFGGCYGTCPVQQIVIFKSGNVLYDGFEYVDNIGSFKSTVKRQQFSNIARRFKEAKYNVLYDDYFESVSDMRRIIVTFYQNNKIIKSVSDYASSSPDEFQWAYIKVEHLISQLKMYKDTTRVASDNFKLLPPPVKE